MCLMNSVLHPYLNKFVIVFIDNILVYSKNEEEHVENLTTPSIFFTHNQLYVKLNKLNFFRAKVHYLGHVVSEDGMVVEP